MPRHPIVLLLGLTLPLAACGGNGSSAPASGGTGTEAAAAPAAPTSGDQPTAAAPAGDAPTADDLKQAVASMYLQDPSAFQFASIDLSPGRAASVADTNAYYVDLNQMIYPVHTQYTMTIGSDVKDYNTHYMMYVKNGRWNLAADSQVGDVNGVLRGSSGGG